MYSLPRVNFLTKTEESWSVACAKKKRKTAPQCFFFHRVDWEIQFVERQTFSSPQSHTSGSAV